MPEREEGDMRDTARSVLGSRTDLGLALRRHGIEMRPEARAAAQSTVDDLIGAARLVRQDRPMVARTAYVFAPEALIRTLTAE
jgi:hypothetical protein